MEFKHFSKLQLNMKSIHFISKTSNQQPNEKVCTDIIGNEISVVFLATQTI